MHQDHDRLAFSGSGLCINKDTTIDHIVTIGTLGDHIPAKCLHLAPDISSDMAFLLVHLSAAVQVNSRSGYPTLWWAAEQLLPRSGLHPVLHRRENTPGDHRHFSFLVSAALMAAHALTPVNHSLHEYLAGCHAWRDGPATLESRRRKVASSETENSRFW